jgi:hypothetical protein
MLIVTPTRRGYKQPGGQTGPSYFRRCMGCVAHRIFEIGWGYVKQVEIVGGDRSSRRRPLTGSQGPASMRGDVMSKQSVRQAARRSALDAQAVLRKERADRERRLEALAVAVLTALGERDAAVRDAERRAGEALRTMTIDEGPVAAGGGRVVRQWRPYGARGHSEVDAFTCRAATDTAGG